MTFMPERPYLPLGTLRAAVCYPAEPGRFDEAAVVAALERVDLGDLVPSLDRSERWDRQLPLDEQQRLAFARLLLHAPRWVVLDDAVSALSDLHLRRVLSFCDRERSWRSDSEAWRIGSGDFVPHAACRRDPPIVRRNIRDRTPIRGRHKWLTASEPCLAIGARRRPMPRGVVTLSPDSGKPQPVGCRNRSRRP
jgi:hypothetical protein